MSYRTHNPMALVLALLTWSAASPSPAAMVEHLSFNEAHGTVVHDSSGYGNDGTFQGASWIEGVAGSALAFDGEGGHVEIANSNSLNIQGNAITIAAWFKRSALNDDGAFVFKNSQYCLAINDQGRLSFSLYTPTWYSVVMNWPDRLMDTKWHLVAAVYDGATMAIYLDGTEIVSGANTGNIQQQTSNIWVGSQSEGLNQFGGILDEVSIYDHALSGTALAAMIPEPTTLGLVVLGGIAALMRRRRRA